MVFNSKCIVPSLRIVEAEVVEKHVEFFVESAYFEVSEKFLKDSVLHQPETNRVVFETQVTVKVAHVQLFRITISASEKFPNPDL